MPSFKVRVGRKISAMPTEFQDLIDTHCHLNHAKMSEDVAGCLERAKEAGVEQMIVVGYDIPSSEQAVHLSEAYPSILFAAVGVHPHDAKHWDKECEARIRAWSNHPGVVA